MELLTRSTMPYLMRWGRRTGRMFCGRRLRLGRAGTPGTQSIAYFCLRSLRRHPVHFFLQVLFPKALPLQYPLAVLDHIRVSTEIRNAIGSRAVPLVGVFTDQFIHATHFALPVRIFPRTAGGEDATEPRNFLCERFQFLAINKLPGAARTVQQ